MITIGWKEYVGLPDLGINRLKVKMDTGARTSVLHVARYDVDGDRVRMTVLGHRSTRETEAEAPLEGMLEVRNTSGVFEERPVIRTTLTMGETSVLIAVTLADRTGMLFRMLVGRKALEALGAVVDVRRKYLLKRRGSST